MSLIGIEAFPRRRTLLLARPTAILTEEALCNRCTQFPLEAG